MKQLGVILLAALAAPLVQQARADDKAPTKDDKGSAEVLKADDAFTEAIAKGDAQAFDKLTSDDYVLSSSRGSLWDKAKNLEALKSKDLTYDGITDEEQKAHLYGDVAVVTGLSKIKGKYKDRTFDDSFRWTRVWVHHGAAWVCVAEHMSRVQPLTTDTEKPKDKETPKPKDK